MTGHWPPSLGPHSPPCPLRVRTGDAYAVRTNPSSSRPNTGRCPASSSRTCYTPDNPLGSSPLSGDAASRTAVTLRYLALKHPHACCFRGRDTIENQVLKRGFSKPHLGCDASHSCSRTGWNRSRGPTHLDVHELENMTVAPDVTNPWHCPRHIAFPSSTPAMPLRLLRRVQGLRYFATHAAHPRGVSGGAFGGTLSPQMHGHSLRHLLRRYSSWSFPLPPGHPPAQLPQFH